MRRCSPSKGPGPILRSARSSSAFRWDHPRMAGASLDRWECAAHVSLRRLAGMSGQYGRRFSGCTRQAGKSRRRIVDTRRRRHATAVSDSAPMRNCQRRSDLAAKAQRHGFSQRLAAISAPKEPRGNRLPFEKFHEQVEGSVRQLSRVEDPHHAGMLGDARGARFVEEPRPGETLRDRVPRRKRSEGSLPERLVPRSQSPGANRTWRFVPRHGSRWTV